MIKTYLIKMDDKAVERFDKFGVIVDLTSNQMADILSEAVLAEDITVDTPMILSSELILDERCDSQVRLRGKSVRLFAVEGAL